MLLYGSAYQMPEEPELRSEAGELFAAITSNHYRDASACFARLEELGAVLGNNGFSVAVVQNLRRKSAATALQAADSVFVRAAIRWLTAPVWYCYTISGQLYFLFCHTRLSPGDDAGRQRVLETELEDFGTILHHIAPPGDYRVLVSDVYSGEHEVFMAANALRHAMEYFNFRTETPRLIHLDSQQQLHGAFVSDLSDYRMLAAETADKLTNPALQGQTIAEEICDTLMGKCAPSMESVHHHLQIFGLTFTDYLGSNGIINDSYLKHRRVVDGLMRFETERELRERVTEMILDLQKQYARLRAVGRQNRIQDLKDYIDRNIADPSLSVAALSERFGISANQISSQFQRYHGMSLHRYLQTVRVNLALELMKDPQLTVAEAAERAGYTDVSTMYRAFRRITGVSPGALRKGRAAGGASEAAAAEQLQENGAAE